MERCRQRVAWQASDRTWKVERGRRQTLDRHPAFRERHSPLWQPTFCAWLAEAHASRGEFSQGLAALEIGRQAAAGGTHWMDAELLRVEGELRQIGGLPDHIDAESILSEALVVARSQSSRTLELRDPSTCTACGAALTAAMATDHVARQVFDLPEPQPLIVTEHRAHGCRCAACGTETRAAFPEDVTAPVQYGARIAAVVLYLLHYQLLPEKRLAALMADLFGVHLVTATIAGMSRSCAARFQGFAAAVRDHVAAAPVKHMDETGFRIGGKTQWLHIASTIWLTFYRVSPKRGSLLANVLGIVVHDHWKPYYTLKGVLHALCNAHHLRELQALVEIEKEDWARKMQRLLRRAGVCRPCDGGCGDRPTEGPGRKAHRNRQQVGDRQGVRLSGAGSAGEDGGFVRRQRFDVAVCVRIDGGTDD